MTNKKHLLPLALIMLLSPLTAFAESLTDPGVPHTINLQTMIYDAENKVTTSEKVDMTIRIVDADNNVLFSETQNDVDVAKGAVKVSIGELSGGIPLEVLDPSEGTRLIDIEVHGQAPFELMPLGAIPYAMWSEKSLTVANDSIGSEQIKNGTIKTEDLDPLEFGDIGGQLTEGQLPGTAVTVRQLDDHKNSTTAHLASAIVVSGHFVTFVADDVQEALEKLDAKLVDEIFNRQNMDINDVKGILGQAKIDAAIARDSEVITIIGNAPDGSIAWTKIDKTGAVPGDVGAAPAVHNHDTDYVNVTGDTMTGNLSFTDASCPDNDGDGSAGPCWVDGVDVSTDLVRRGGDTMTGPLVVPDPGDDPVPPPPPDTFNVGDRLRNHENRLGALEGDTLPDNVRDFQMTFVVNSIGGDSSDNLTFGGADSTAWSVCDGGCDTDNDSFIYTDRNPIVVPANCIAMASGTIAANPNSYESPASGGFRADNTGYLRISYSDTRTVNLRANAIGDDGYFEVSVRVIALPATNGADCRVINWSY